VPPLPEHALQGLLQRLLGLDADLALAVARGTGGNPLLAVQLVGHWIGRARLEVSTLGWRLTDRRSVQVELETLWEDRLRAIAEVEGPQAIVALELAAVAGSEHTGEAWAALAGRVGLEDPGSCADHLLRAGLAESADPGGPGGWRFAHAQFREALESRARAEGRLAESSSGGRVPGGGHRRRR
jgi:hypothetical protein